MEDFEKNEKEDLTQDEVSTEGSQLNGLLKLLSFGVIAILGYLIITTSLKTCGKHDIRYGNGEKFGEEEFDDGLTSALDTSTISSADTNISVEIPAISTSDTMSKFSIKTTPEKTSITTNSEKPQGTTPSTTNKSTVKSDEKSITEPSKTVKTTIAEKPNEPINNNTILVIAGNYLKESNAKELQKKLAKAGIKNTEVKVFDFSEFYTVIVGRHKDMAEAKKMVSTLKSKGFESYTHQKRKK